MSVYPTIHSLTVAFFTYVVFVIGCYCWFIRSFNTNTSDEWLIVLSAASFITNDGTKPMLIVPYRTRISYRQYKRFFIRQTAFASFCVGPIPFILYTVELFDDAVSYGLAVIPMWMIRRFTLLLLRPLLTGSTSATGGWRWIEWSCMDADDITHAADTRQQLIKLTVTQPHLLLC